MVDLLRTVNVYILRESYMNAHVLFSLLNELGKWDKMRGFYRFFATGLINSIIQEHDLSHDIKLLLKTKILPSFKSSNLHEFCLV